MMPILIHSDDGDDDCLTSDVIANDIASVSARPSLLLPSHSCSQLQAVGGALSSVVHLG